MADMLCTLMVLCRGKDENGEPCWAYMAIKPSQARHFAEARARGAFDLNDFGTVLESGAGDEPSQEVRNRMRDRFGMRDDFEEQLKRAVAEA